MDVPANLIFKICVFGETAVGKTSLIRQRLDGKFASNLQSRGDAAVEIDTVGIGSETAARLVLWEIIRPDGIAAIHTPYVVGMHAYILVCDITRRPTLTSVRAMQQQLVSQYGPLPFCLLINKSDLAGSAEISAREIKTMSEAGWTLHTTSAKNGSGVTQAFNAMAATLTHASTR